MQMFFIFLFFYLSHEFLTRVEEADRESEGVKQLLSQ